MVFNIDKDYYHVLEKDIYPADFIRAKANTDKKMRINYTQI